MRLQKCSASVLHSRVIFFLLAAILLLGPSAVFGQVWAKKDYKEWSQKDCQKILTDSPWAKTMKFYGSGVGSQGAEGQAYTEYTVQLFSALPIRQAMVCLKMEPESLLTADYADQVFVKVKYMTNAGQQSIMNLDREWQTETLGTMQNSTFLIGSKGVKVAVTDFKLAQGAGYFLLVFPRQKDGKDVLSVNDKNLIIQFNYPVISGMGDGRGQFEFKVKDMVYNGKIAY